MSSIIIEIPDDLAAVIERHKDIDWKHIAQKSLLEYARKIALADRLTEKSALTEEDVAALDKHLKSELAKKYQR